MKQRPRVTHPHMTVHDLVICDMYIGQVSRRSTSSIESNIDKCENERLERHGHLSPLSRQFSHCLIHATVISALWFLDSSESVRTGQKPSMQRG